MSQQTAAALSVQLTLQHSVSPLSWSSASSFSSFAHCPCWLTQRLLAITKPQILRPLAHQRAAGVQSFRCLNHGNAGEDPGPDSFHFSSIGLIGLTQLFALTGGWLLLRKSQSVQNVGQTLVPEHSYGYGGGCGKAGGGSGSWGGGGGGGHPNGSNNQTSFHFAKDSSGEDQSDTSQEESYAEVSIIIPALNEAACIATTVGQFQLSQPPPARVIVVDGGSIDGTQEKARQQGAVVVSSPKGRARQQNRGAEVAVQMAGGGGGILCFVHADTLVPMDLVSDLLGCSDTSEGCSMDMWSVTVV